MRLSDHFTLEELTFSQTAARKGIPNNPPGFIVDNLTRLCATLEKVRFLLNKPIRISSGFRSVVLNTEIGGAHNSQHTMGTAADILVSGMTPDEVVQAVMKSDIGYDQLIREFNRWTHISVPNNLQEPPRKQVLIIDSEGTRAYGN